MKAILITGCSHGLGRTLALHFAALNYRVYAVARNIEELATLTNPNISLIIADITKAIDRQKISEQVAKETTLSLIHNAGIAIPNLFSTLPEYLLREHLETNCFAPLLLTQKLLPLLKNNRVLHITSAAAYLALPGLLPYCISKAAFKHATACLNSELNNNGIHFANLSPGLIDTPMGENFRNSNVDKLPHRDFYLQAKAQDKLIAPSVAAAFIAWVMLKTDNQMFTTTDWQIYDNSHHYYWLPQGAEIPVL